MKQKIEIPVFESEVYIVVADDPYGAEGRQDAELVRFFGPNEDGEDWNAICLIATEGNSFCLIFDSSFFSVSLLAHEVFHLTNTILAYHEIECEETGALLHGYLMGRLVVSLRDFFKA